MNIPVQNCSSCAACANVCARSAISMQLDAEGFYRPVIDAEKCTNCRRCIKQLGCPGLVLKDGRVHIEHSLCTGCGLCAQVCPFQAIGGAVSCKETS